MSVSKPDSPCGPAFCDPLRFPVLLYVQEYAIYLDASHFTDMHARDRGLTVRVRHNVLGDTNAGASVKR